MPHSLAVFRPARAAAAALVALALGACSGHDNGKAGAGGAPGGGMPPPEVGVISVTSQTLPLPTELPGRVEPSRIAQVRARVTGIVQKRLFTEGSDVKAGQVLFQIDAAPYRAAVESARATLAKAQANLTQAGALAARYKPLREANAISQQDYVNAQAAQAQAEADVAGAKAALLTAQLNLGYASVTAPISGRIGRAMVTEGALVSAAEATQLAVVQQINPAYVNFSQPVTQVHELQRAIAKGQLQTVGKVTPVRILFEDGSELKQHGKLLFSDLTVDPTTGQVTLRAEVPNADGALLPGMYVRGRLALAQVDKAMEVPQQAVTRTAQGDSVMVVGADNKPAPRPVKLGGASGQSWIVLDGLNPGDKVIVDGFQKMRPGAPVKPVPWSGGPGAAPAASAPASAASR